MADVDVWPISTLLMADMVFCVADLVVADMVCGRYRRFPKKRLDCEHSHAQEWLQGGKVHRFCIPFTDILNVLRCRLIDMINYIANGVLYGTTNIRPVWMEALVFICR